MLLRQRKVKTYHSLTLAINWNESIFNECNLFTSDMCSKIHACAFHRQRRDNRSQMDLLNRKVFPNIKRSLWNSRTSGHSVWRYIITKLACYRLLNQKGNFEKFLESLTSRLFASWFFLFFHSLGLPSSFSCRFIPFRSFIRTRLLTLFVRSCTRSVHLSFIRSLVSFRSVSFISFVQSGFG